MKRLVVASSALVEPLSADVVVIGSGICGALTARKLARKGAYVLMLGAGPRVTRARLLANFRNSPRRSDWMSHYPLKGKLRRDVPGENGAEVIGYRAK